jgi:HPt (histidine-containing phosphotransfer) domain-containing protein
MGKRLTGKPQRSGRRHALLKPIAALRKLLVGYRDGARSGTSGDADIIRDGGSRMAFTAPARLSDKLASELFARLLLELPEQRRDLLSAYRDDNLEQLARSTHKLLGAVVYCELPDLAAALRELAQTLRSGEAGQTGPAFGNAIRLIDELLAYSGYSGD